MNTHAKHVLIVDDEPNVRLMFRTALEAAGYYVEEAEDGPSGLERLQRSPSDLVLLDLKMPGPSGLDVLRSIREAGNDVPVVFVTAHGTIPDAVAAMKLGAIDFLSKPLTPEILRRVVEEVVRREEPTVIEPSASHATTVALGTPVIDLAPAKRALNLRDFNRAAQLIEEALDINEHSAEAHTLLGLVHECRGQNHAAYHSYKQALAADPNFGPALDNLRLYCQKYGLDFQSPAINPALTARR